MATKTRGKPAGRAQIRHKHLKLDQRKIAFAVRYFGAKSEEEAVDKALSLLMDEQSLLENMKLLQGSLRRDQHPWPYQ